MKQESDEPARIILPHADPTKSEITPKERLVYLFIKNHLNHKTKQCNPSLATLKEESGISIPTIRKSIAILQRNGYLEVIKKGRSQQYVFNDVKKFEEISEELLLNKEISIAEKSLLTSSIEFMLEKGNTGKIGYTNKELAETINMSESTVSRCLRSLGRNGYITTVHSNMLDSESGCKKEIKIIDLEKLGQAVIYKIKEHEEELKKHSERMDDLDYKIELLTKELEDRKRSEAESQNSVKLLMKELQYYKNNQKELIID